jgi:hypothetical protein
MSSTSPQDEWRPVRRGARPFLKAIVSRCWDPQPRLIFADWLD